MKNRPLLLLLLTVATFLSCSSHNSKKEYLIELSSSQDATLEVFKVIERIEKDGGEATISFERGTYNFYPEFAFEKYQFYSNHGDYLTRIGFYLNGLKNVTIDGNGSSFIFHGVLAPFVVENCNNIEIKNLSVDYKYPFYSEGKIVATNPNEQYFDMEICDKYRYEIRDNQLIFLTPYYEFPIGQNHAYDPKTRSVAHDGIHIPDQGVGVAKKIVKDNQYYTNYGFDYKYGIDPYDWAIRQRGTRELYSAKEIKKGLVRIHTKVGRLPKVGHVMVMKGRQGYNRLFAGFKFENVKDLYLENVTLHHAAGMGYLYENCENTDMYRCKLIPSGDRFISATADATHYSGCRGALSMRDCIMQSQLDDGTNIHGAFKAIEKAVGKNSLIARSIHHQQLGFILGRKGDKIVILDPKQNLKVLYTLTLESTQQLNGRYQILSFKEELPTDIDKNLLLENITALPTVLIENSNFSRNRARALLISTWGGTVIRNNHFSVEMSGVMLLGQGYEYYWAESGYAANVVIEGNTFENCCLAKKLTPSIVIRNGQNFDKIAIENIDIKDNTFKQSENYILEIDGAKNISFKGNTILNNKQYPQRFPQQAAITVANCLDLSFANNNYKGNSDNIVEYKDNSQQVAFE